MQLDEALVRAIAQSHALDRVAYLGLGHGARGLADRSAKLLLLLRIGIAQLWHKVLRGSEYVLSVLLDWLLWLGDKLLFAPYRAVVRVLIAFGRALAVALKQVVAGALGLAGLALGALDAVLGLIGRLLPARTGGGLKALIEQWRVQIRRTRLLLKVLKRIAQRAIERAWRRLGVAIRSAIAAFGYGIDWVSRNLMFRPLVWLFNPRLPGGRPLLYSEALTRLAGFLLAAVALYIGVLVLAYIKAKALMLHGTINVRLWKVDAPLLLNVIKIGAAHAAISAGVAASKFVLLPVLAAARRGIKNNAMTQAIAYRYVRRKMAAERLLARAAFKTASGKIRKPRASLRFVEKLVHHIVAGTVPEAYEVKMRSPSDRPTHA